MGTKIINSFAENGGQYVNGTSQVTPTNSKNTIFAIQVVDNCVFSQMDSNLTGTGLLTDTFVVGLILYGTFKSFTLTSGAVIAYEG